MKRGENSEMRLLFALLSVGIGIVGLIIILFGRQHPAQYQETLAEAASAVQVTQIYTEAMHTVTVGIGIVCFAVLIAVVGILLCNKANKSPLEEEAN